MCCDNHASGHESERLEVGAVSRPFEGSAAAWVIGQAVRYLNSADKDAERAYARVIDVLRHCGADVLDAVRGIFKQVQGGDSSLRWSVLYVLGDAANADAGGFLAGIALKPLPEQREGAGCESDRDMEMLVSTGAVHALHRVATRHPEAIDDVLKVVAERPARPILIEAIKVACELRLRDKVQHLLPKDDHWMLDIRKAHAQEMFAKPEREDGTERGFTPPKSGALYTAPTVGCCTNRGM